MARPHDRSVALLVVEDEYLIRMDTTSYLESAGFIVFEAENSAEAIRCLELHAEISLIFNDINMPGSMDGLALAHYVRGRWPPVKIIVTSATLGFDAKNDFATVAPIFASRDGLLFASRGFASGRGFGRLELVEIAVEVRATNSGRGHHSEELIAVKINHIN